MRVNPSNQHQRGRPIRLSDGRRRHFLFTGAQPALPIYVESIGYNPEQESVDREEGYPCFHWLETVSGEGIIEVAGQSLTLPPHTGILLYPNIKHSYRKGGDEWSTSYITFDGSQAAPMVTSLGFRHSEWFKWEQEASELSGHLHRMLGAIETADDRSGLDASSGLYRFLLLLKKYGQVGSGSSLFQHMERLNPLLAWLDSNYSDPAVGLPEMADQLNVSPRYLNMLFRKAFGMTAYTYLIQLRLSKAKELISGLERKPIMQIAQEVGYRDASHFISVFRKAEGMTPEQFRKLH
ncbi:AraC-like DNA-binding protein [Paenibacillus cellulosilyticus]|uniref:AraC-like DNA-binding protein n=1 Tax=Paenibacillus cellulosilyticus TaxID=375489 RepID=A0A2V2YAT3_9BACL|nr:AraC family transcriptional regulator [Paenibacillus cellulosilyticus]PWV88445.1 AraC-like DNA-binding protein [Paenibacillus cellulosilyticus]QKS44288.1 helix-turn-helix transcriptional regulator [Paenibacillus cellulosilyticus]